VAERVLRQLTAHEHGVLHPQVARLAELEGEVGRQREMVRRMLALLEPAFAAGDPGVRFDAGRMAFVRDADGEGEDGGEDEDG
jgi:hypothetical protein